MTAAMTDGANAGIAVALHDGRWVCVRTPCPSLLKVAALFGNDVKALSRNGGTGRLQIMRISHPSCYWFGYRTGVVFLDQPVVLDQSSTLDS
jgi:hypothetical protein